MDWVQAFPKEKEPTFAQIDAFISNPLWRALGDYLHGAYQVEPKKSYSTCSGQPGWNVKYKKGGKSLCTLYPLEGYYIALVVIGEKERTEAELLLPAFAEYSRGLYARAATLMGAKWLMMEVRDEAVLEDVKRLIAVRRRPK